MHSPAPSSLSETPIQLPLLRAPHDTIELPHTPESQPQVSFDINLQDRVSNIDFNTEAYGAYLHERGLTDDQVANTSLQFDSKPLSVRPSYYDPDTGTIHARVSDWRSEHTLNKAIGHETEHHINQLSGLADKWRPLIYAHNLSTLIGPPLAVAGSALSHVESLNTPGKVIMGLGMIALAAGQAAYYSNPDEISAHRAGHNAPPLVTIQR